MNWGAVGALVGVAGIAFAAGTWVVSSGGSLNKVASRVTEIEKRLPTFAEKREIPEDIVIREELKSYALRDSVILKTEAKSFALTKQLPRQELLSQIGGLKVEVKRNVIATSACAANNNTFDYAAAIRSPTRRSCAKFCSAQEDGNCVGLILVDQVGNRVARASCSDVPKDIYYSTGQVYCCCK